MHRNCGFQAAEAVKAPTLSLFGAAEAATAGVIVLNGTLFAFSSMQITDTSRVAAFPGGHSIDTTVQGFAIQGFAVQGFAVQGFAVQGFAVQGLAVQGFVVQSTVEFGLVDRRSDHVADLLQVKPPIAIHSNQRQLSSRRRANDGYQYKPPTTACDLQLAANN